MKFGDLDATKYISEVILRCHQAQIAHGLKAQRPMKFQRNTTNENQTSSQIEPISNCLQK